MSKRSRRTNPSQPRVVEKKKEFNSNLEYGQKLADNRQVTTDRDVPKIVLDVFTDTKSPQIPEGIDKFILNTIELSEKGEKLVPWILSVPKTDEIIETSISNASTDEDLSDMIVETSAPVEKKPKQKIEVS